MNHPQNHKLSKLSFYGNVKTSSLLLLLIIFGFDFTSKACSPLQIPTLTSWNLTGTNLNLNWQSNTIYNCTYSVQVEISCISSPFTGVAPFYISSGINKNSTPYPYPLQTINVSSFCPGSVYQFRAREVYGTSTFSGWTTTYTFTTPGTFVAPTLSLTSSASSICPPQTSQLTAQVINGCGSAPPYNYTWTPATGLSCTTCSNPIASPIVNTTYTCAVSGGKLGCWTATNSITILINTIPPVVGVISSTPTTMCAGNSASLSMTSYTGSIQWQSGSSSSGPWTNIAGATSSAVVTPTLASNTCYQALVTGCGATLPSNTVCITVNPTPTVTVNSATICAGQTANLTANGATSYAWTAGATTTGVNTANASPLVTTSYTVTGTSAGCTGTAVSTVSVNPLPVPTATNNGPICTGAALNLGAGGGGTYQWSGPNGFSSALQNPSVASSTTLDAGVYNLTVTLNGCTSNTTTTVVITTPTASATNTGPYCAGATIQLNTPAALSYTWTGPAGFNSNLQNPTAPAVSSANSGIYTLVVSVGGCNASATTSVTVFDKPVANPSSNSPVCENDPINFTGSGGVNYLWTGPSFNSNLQNPSILGSNSSHAGNYTLTVIDANSCSHSAVINVVVNPLPIISVNNPVVCEATNINLIAAGGSGFNWSGPLGFTSTLQNPTIPAAIPAMSGAYNLTVTSVAGCTSTAISNVLVNPSPVPNIVTNSPICINNVLSFVGTGGVSYLWSGPNGFSSSVQNPTISANTTNYTGSYNLTVTDANGCVASTLTPVVVNPIPNVSITSSAVGGCSPFCVSYNVNASASVVNYNWNLGNGMTDITSSPSTCYYTTGIYTVAVGVTDVNGCSNSTTHTIEVYPTPVADFNHSPIKPIINVDGDVIFTDASYGANVVSWNWFFMNTAQYTSNLQNPTFLYSDPGTYVVALVVKSDHGCIDTILRPLVVGEDFGIYVPNAFTPNGDGLNEVFQPKGFGIVKYELQIFDRWGERIFSTKTFEQGWDGKVHKGVDYNVICEEGVYTWLINVTNVFGKAHELKGHVTLIK